MKTIRNDLALRSSILLTLAGCGGHKGGVHDADAVAAAIANPSGEVANAADAQGVAAAFEERLAQDVAPTGERRQGSDCTGTEYGGHFTCSCSGGGSLTGSASGDERDYEATFSYDACCIEGCCVDGDGWIAGTSDPDADYTLCASFSVTFDCSTHGEGATALEYCMDADHNFWYLVEYESMTYAVSGYYNRETGGHWTIRDAGGEWACASDGATGSCTDGADTYLW